MDSFQLCVKWIIRCPLEYSFWKKVLLTQKYFHDKQYFLSSNKVSDPVKLFESKNHWNLILFLTKLLYVRTNVKLGLILLTE